MPQQAYSPTYRPQSRGGYQQPRQGGSKLYYTDGTKIPGARIDASVKRVTMMGGPNEGPLAPRGNQFTPNRPAPTRQGNIDAARADGTFDAKRAAYNAANKDSFMDESGKIGPKAPLPTGNPSNERVPVPAATSPAAAPAAKTTPQMMGPPRPATFEGKSRAEWFANAAKKEGAGNQYTDYKVPSSVAQTKPTAPSSAPTSKPAPIVAPAGSPVAASSVVATKQPSTTTPAGVPAPTMSNPDARERYNKAMQAASTPVASAPAPSKAPAAAPSMAAVKPQPQPQVSTPPASSMTTAAVRPPPVSQAVKNPQGMSARMGADQPSPMPKLLADPIGTVSQAKDLTTAVASAGLKAAANITGNAIENQADKNPDGIAGKLTRLFSPTKPRQVASK